MIPTYRRVLVATDFSEHGNAAIPHAYSIVSRSGGTVFLFHSIDDPGTPNPLYAHFSLGRARTSAQKRALKRAMTERLEALVPPEARRKAAVRSVCVVDATAGPAHESICRKARSVGADAIVVGSHGHGGILRLLLGSEAESVLRAATVPVLIVRTGAGVAARALAAPRAASGGMMRSRKKNGRVPPKRPPIRGKPVPVARRRK